MNEVCFEFVGDDEAYLRWLKQNSKGYVVNTERSKPKGYMVLHKAKCRSISQYTNNAQLGGFTERQYIKVCSVEKARLQEWVKQHGRTDGSFSKECGICKP